MTTLLSHICSEKKENRRGDEKLLYVGKTQTDSRQKKVRKRKHGEKSKERRSSGRGYKISAGAIHRKKVNSKPDFTSGFRINPYAPLVISSCLLLNLNWHRRKIRKNISSFV